MGVGAPIFLTFEASGLFQKRIRQDFFFNLNLKKASEKSFLKGFSDAHGAVIYISVSYLSGQ